MVEGPAPPPDAAPTPRLWAALAAVACAAGMVAVMHGLVGREVRRDVERFNVPPEAGRFDGVALQKLNGLAVQRAAFGDPAILPVYGSSEMTQPQPDRPDDFFRAHPTGFGAFLVAYPGETSLIIATKLAALGPAARGHKAVVFLSPTWFQLPQLEPGGFGINFSPLHGSRLAIGSWLSPELRHDFARRLLDYPDLVAQFPLLKAALGCDAGERPVDRFLQATMTPLVAVQDRFLIESDYAKVGLWLKAHPPRPAANPAAGLASIDWDTLMREADERYTRQPALTTYSTTARSGWDDARARMFRDAQHPEVSPDVNFERVCLTSKEWTDLDLLLRTARELDVRLLLVCQPLNANFCALQGLTPRSSELFYNRLYAAVDPFKTTTLLTFPQAETDPHWYVDSTHPTAKAWLAYDRRLDAFFHAP